MRPHEHRLLAEEAAAVDAEPGPRRDQHGLVADERDLAVGVARVQLLLHHLIEAEHADQVPRGPLATVEVDEGRLVLYWNERDTTTCPSTSIWQFF